MPAVAFMNELVGRVARSLAGHDKGEIFWVVGAEGEFLLLCDGKTRRIARPKRKKLRHAEILTGEDTLHPTAEKLRRNEPVSDRELKRALTAFKGEISLGKR